MWRAWILQGTWKEKASTNRLLSHRGTPERARTRVPRKDHDGGSRRGAVVVGLRAVVRSEPPKTSIRAGLNPRVLASIRRSTLFLSVGGTS
jgi:hypothetical protein